MLREFGMYFLNQYRSTRLFVYAMLLSFAQKYRDLRIIKFRKKIKINIEFIFKISVNDICKRRK